MIAPLVKRILLAPGKFLRERRSATAVALALMAVPMFIAGEAAVNVARLVTAHTLLQAAVDNAANAGASAWHLSESPAYANSVTISTFKGAASNLATFGSYTTPTPNLACNGVSSVCNATNDATSYVTTPATYNCPNASAAQYCVAVTAQVVIHNWLASLLVPTSALTVTGYGQQGLTSSITGKNIPPSPGFGSAGDVSGIYAYAVPMSGSGTGGSPEFNQMPQPNSACSSYSSIGPLALTGLSSTAASTCNYLFIALSTSSGTAGAGGALTLDGNQPIAFSFINYTGANGYDSSTYYQTSTNLEVYENNSSTPTYYQNGLTVTMPPTTIYTKTTYTCSSTNLDSDGDCPTTSTSSVTTSTYGYDGTYTRCSRYKNHSCTQYQTIITTSSTVQNQTALQGECPDHTLYGSLDPISVNSDGTNAVGIPVADSLNTYSSAYEVLGEPPTYETNHALIPFMSPISWGPIYDANGNSYTVQAVCPNYSTSGTSISAPISSAYANATGWTGLNIYSTSFPGQTYSDSALRPAEDTSGLYTSNTSIWMTSDSNDYYPPSISGCTAAYNAYDGGITPTSQDPWWDWVGSNSGNCNNESSSYQSGSSAFYAATTLPNGNTAYQPSYNNCTLVIQDLGTGGGNTPNVPVNSNNQALLPDYYLKVTNSSGTIVGLDPIYDGQSWYDLMPGVITSQLTSIDSQIKVSNTTANYVTDTDTAATYNSNGTIYSYGYVPSSTHSYTLTSGTYSGDTVTVETPASTSSSSSATNTEFHLPPATSHQCYNPANNGNTSGTNGVTLQAGQGSTISATASTSNNPVTANPIDHVANPQLGAILCDSANPETYALYWNDLGTYESDDLGYWNAVTAFTCSVPGSSRTGGLATLSG